jgi:hypothetical protein
MGVLDRPREVTVMKRASNRWAWWVLLGVVTATVASAMSAPEVATRIRNKICSKWRVSGLQVNVIPYRDPAFAKQGRYQKVMVDATSVWVSDVRMSPVRIRATDVTLDLPQLVTKNLVVTTRRKTADFVTRVSEEDLNRALAHKDTPIQNLHVQLCSGTLVFTGRYTLGLGANLRLEGRLESPDHCQINFIPVRASVSGVPLPPGPLKIVLNKLNPLLDLRKIPLSPRVDKITVQPSGLVFEG